jgi:glycosyltransferase involved in cell wall biosynthesis
MALNLINNNPIILHILYSGLGGHSAVLLSLLEAGFMNEAEHTILFVGVEEPTKDSINRCENLKIKWDYLPKNNVINIFNFQFSIFRKLVLINPNILFIHGLAAIPAIILMKIFKPLFKPFILIRETQANHLKTFKDWVLLIFANHIASIVVNLTNEAASETIKKLSFLIVKKKIIIIPNGLDTTFYSPSSNKIKNKDVIQIGMQSRLQPNKDHITLIKAFAQICKCIPEKQFHLNIAGHGITYYEILGLIKQMGLSKSVTLYGTLGKFELLNFLNNLDIYVHCTHGETMSNSIMQALSCGLPVIASNVSGVNNMINEESGILYSPGDSEDLANKILCLVKEPEIIEKLKIRARMYAINNYSISSTKLIYENLLRIY